MNGRDRAASLMRFARSRFIQAQALSASADAVKIRDDDKQIASQDRISRLRYWNSAIRTGHSGVCPYLKEAELDANILSGRLPARRCKLEDHTTYGWDSGHNARGEAA